MAHGRGSGARFGVMSVLQEYGGDIFLAGSRRLRATEDTFRKPSAVKDPGRPISMVSEQLQTELSVKNGCFGRSKRVKARFEAPTGGQASQG